MVMDRRFTILYKITAFCLILLSVPGKTISWNFPEAGTSGDAFIWRFAVWKNRAFLAIPRLERNGPNGTLLETRWPESDDSSFTDFNFNNDFNINSCEGLQSVTGLDVDPRGRLWALDAPTQGACPPKIIVYNLKKYNEKLTSVELKGVAAENLRVLRVDPINGPWGFRAFIGDPGDETIIVYSPKQGKWWKLRLSHTHEIPKSKVFSTDMAICRRNSKLLITGQTNDLFSLDLELVRNTEQPAINASVNWLGGKLGHSLGLFCDARNGIHYFLISQKTSVRWDTARDLKAESHSILLQSEKVPCITDYAMDSQRTVWAVTNSKCSLFVKETSTSRKPLESRTVRILKYPYAS